MRDSQIQPSGLATAPREQVVVQGEYRVSNDPAAVLSTLLGSCVATCLFDPVAQVGGMNHFLLASRPGRPDASERYGLYAMEVLINGLLKLGASKSRLEAKLFGGATMSGVMGHIGAENGRFAIDFLAREGIPVRATSLGGQQARRLRFLPTTGRASQKLVEDAEALIGSPPPRPKASDIQFFED